jgi:hypothetical protein
MSNSEDLLSRFGRICGAERRKPGYPLQSFASRKDFRFYPLRGGAAAPGQGIFRAGYGPAGI